MLSKGSFVGIVSCSNPLVEERKGLIDELEIILIIS